MTRIQFLYMKELLSRDFHIGKHDLPKILIYYATTQQAKQYAQYGGVEMFFLAGIR